MMRAIGWELRFRENNSDKFYRVIVTHRIVVINYGRYGSIGQSYVKICTGLDDARGRAVKITVGKEHKGYQSSRPVTEFVIDRGDYSDIINGDSPAQATARGRIVQSFLAAAPEHSP
ncbi:hypothetical protein GCM10022226_61910 [Sphaerisporangium flaviroseum]|uniref:WGR domain-containing protein n=1 Tax=Sphaerisporangium flaviroseum TaxID=509199 RepID=A0ABP7J1N9_9ACTN